MLSPQTSSASKDSSAIADQARKGEERKDRIARLLAAKAAKPPTALSVSPSTQPNLGNQRKRPVALDFVEYSSEPIPAKRPFGQSRKETSLIIDVSDVSDDEEMEMDMDMGSPIDETLPIQSSGIAGQRGPSIRDFPPLTDTFTQRQFSSPAPSITPPGAPINKKRETELNRKEKAIQEMKRRIALAEARRKAKQSNGSETPNQPGQLSLNGNDTPRLPPTERANFVSSPDRLHAPSPQLKPESSSTKLPKPSELPHLDPRQRADRRGRIMSLDIPRVELSLQEKLARLHQLQDEQARLRAEIDRSIAEKQKLADELQQLDTTPVESSRPNGLSESRTRSASQASRETGEASTDGAEASRPQSRGDDALRTTQLATTGLASDNGISGDEPGENVEEASEWIAREFEVSTNTLPDAPANSEPNLMQRHANAQADAPDSLVPTSTSKGMVEKFMTATSTSEPADSANADETTPMDLDSRASSPEVTELVSNAGADEETNNSRQHPTPLPEQISTVAQPREAVQELEGEAPPEVHVVSPRKASISWLTSVQVHDEPAQEPQGSLTSYESPLRYFHAYRFHPEYQRTVAGGLKSLTYSNRIDPDREFCPFELNGEQCPANCQFQHFGSIALQDDQILLELGNPDGYNSEEKARFIQGLRELLQRFKADKVKDFNTIARGIIDFRSQLLGDKSKILRLDGVKL
ncbi:hypothetical protein N0V88_003800 [Collariella sp. IMI 366227]|nr:hypothetical protein N0V88_003800 [Collariella sp. IMI 366227]